jgi:DNA-binding SARP family transcriptional activator
LPSLKLYLLGSPKLELDGRPIEISRRKALAMLAYLSVTGQSHTREELATLFWPDYELSQSHACARRAVWALSEALGKGWLDVSRKKIGPVRSADHPRKTVANA